MDVVEQIGTRLLLRPAEAAELLAIGRTKTYALIKSGELPSITIGGSRRVPKEALLAWIEKNTSRS